jgi:hypothetical protein
VKDLLCDLCGLVRVSLTNNDRSTVVEAMRLDRVTPIRTADFDPISIGILQAGPTPNLFLAKGPGLSIMPSLAWANDYLISELHWMGTMPSGSTVLT